MEESNKTVTANQDQTENGEKIDGNDIGDKGEKKPDDKSSEVEANGVSTENDEAKKKQSREKNSFYAEQRRKAKEERERKETETRIRKQVVFEVKKENVKKDELDSLGLNSVETDDDIFLVESYRKSKSEGSENPEAEAYRSLREKKIAEAKEAETKKAKEEEYLQQIAKEQEEVKGKYGKTCKQILDEEPNFKDFLDSFGKEKTFIECYEYFNANIKKAKSEEREESKKTATPPTSTSGSSNGKTNKTKETDEEFKARWIKEHGRW